MKREVRPCGLQPRCKEMWKRRGEPGSRAEPGAEGRLPASLTSVQTLEQTLPLRRSQVLRLEQLFSAVCVSGLVVVTLPLRGGLAVLGHIFGCHIGAG